MTKTRQPLRNRRQTEEIVHDPGLVALLDHLGRLIAKEYVTLLKKDADREASSATRAKK